MHRVDGRDDWPNMAVVVIETGTAGELIRGLCQPLSMPCVYGSMGDARLEHGHRPRRIGGITTCDGTSSHTSVAPRAHGRWERPDVAAPRRRVTDGLVASSQRGRMVESHGGSREWHMAVTSTPRLRL